MTGPETPRIEFPCAYPVKVLGRSTREFRSRVLEVFEIHAPGFGAGDVSERHSRKARFVSITVTITASGPEQLSRLHRALMATGVVQMVL